MRIIKMYKFIIVILLIIIFVELIFIGYNLINKNKKYIYFDGINAMEYNNNYYVAVGSNNDNDNHFEKAKISSYNKKKEKILENVYNVGYNSSFFGTLIDGDNVIAVGSYEKDKSDRKNSVRHALIVKYDLNGKILFEKDFKLLDNSKFTNISKYGDYYYVTGQSVYKNNKIGTDSGGAILCKYDKDGKLIWSKSYGSNKSAIYNNLIICNDSLYVVGNDENYLGIICRYDFDGNIIDYNDYKSTDNIGFSGIVNIEDKIYVSGANRGGDSTDAMIVMYDSSCNYLSEITYDNGGIDRFSKLVLDDDKNIIAIGTMYTTRTDSNESVDEYNYNGIIGKYDSNLNMIDVVNYGDERDDYFTDIIFANEKYLVSGYSSYEDGSYMSKFINYSKALKVLEVE